VFGAEGGFELLDEVFGFGEAEAGVGAAEFDGGDFVAGEEEGADFGGLGGGEGHGIAEWGLWIAE